MYEKIFYISSIQSSSILSFLSSGSLSKLNCILDFLICSCSSETETEFLFKNQGFWINCS
jgi:hypothetical protein